LLVYSGEVVDEVVYADPVFVGQEEDGSLRWKVPDSGFSHIVVVGRALSGDSSREEPVVHFLQQPEDPDFPDINTPFSVAYLPVSFIPVLLKILELSARRRGPALAITERFEEDAVRVVSPSRRLEEVVSQRLPEIGSYWSPEEARWINPSMGSWDAETYRSYRAELLHAAGDWRTVLDDTYGADMVTEEVIRQCRAR
jgi:hypothetical protein